MEGCGASPPTELVAESSVEEPLRRLGLSEESKNRLLLPSSEPCRKCKNNNMYKISFNKNVLNKVEIPKMQKFGQYNFRYCQILISMTKCI